MEAATIIVMVLFFVFIFYVLLLGILLLGVLFLSYIQKFIDRRSMTSDDWL